MMKVFLSSTAVDLAAHRQMADDTILRLSQQSVVMERFGPLPGEPVAECERKARECDVLVCVVGHRYGYVPEPGRGSITRREVEAARAAGRDVLVWIVADDHPWSEKKEQDRLTDPTVLADPEQVAKVIEGVQGLQEFKTWLRSSYGFDTFTTPDDLGRKIAVALSSFAREKTAGSTPASAPASSEIRIVHALQPAPYFHGRESLVAELNGWVSDLASPDRVWALVAVGGTGKTAVVEQVVSAMKPGSANVLVWSFYERPDADAFLRECNQFFLGEEDGPAGGRLERLLRGLRDGRPNLIVLDGLERVQEEAGTCRVRGELTDHTLKLLLRAVAAGMGRARVLLTSRFPLVDLEDWSHRGYRYTRLDDLSPESALAVLRSWGVVGDDEALFAAVAQVGHHALSVAVIGSYLRSFACGRIEAMADFELDAVSGEDPRAAKLARVLAFYAQRLPAEERELLARLSVFPRGTTAELLESLVDAGGDVAGLLLKAKPRLQALLGSLRKRGLIFRYRVNDDSQTIWSAHPFLRDRFRELLGCPAERVFAVVADTLGAGLENRSDTHPTDPAELDRLELTIEATRLAGRVEDASTLYWYQLGNYQHLGVELGEFGRGYRILAAFSASELPGDLVNTLPLTWKARLANDLGLFAIRLGRLAEARAIREIADNAISLGWSSHKQRSVSLQNCSEVEFASGYLIRAQSFADQAFQLAVKIEDKFEMKDALCFRAIAAHAQGNVVAAEADFKVATGYEWGSEYRYTLFSLRGAQYARHLLDCGDFSGARVLASRGLEIATKNARTNYAYPLFHGILARLAMVEGSDPVHNIEEIRAWTSLTGDMEWIINAHLLAALDELASGNCQAALDEAEGGLLHAESCGFGLLRIELLITLARIRLAWPNPPAAIQAARLALDLATAPECSYAWGQADALQAWGEAYAANNEPKLARRAFKGALAVRKRIRHPGIQETIARLALAS